MLYSWEFSLWDDFIRTLDEAVQGSTGKDKVRWLGSPSRTYTPISLCSNAVYDEDVWLNLDLPKVEILVWRVVLQRLPVLEELVRGSLASLDEMVCTVETPCCVSCEYKSFYVPLGRLTD
ncbi:hypothetical protein F3Y22_tig00110402pilonHSYRG00164 [Hibiscus syriacus]|uniref:Reverse transcriptase zinc-binding domain-containing protein n=1 Tax=Hibiscus syriacus TaxID=106335 RepID=A0A6A3AT99_HIBSY|nr:hypothetical protein F3Y22_tig00110402pilonHSYRG00164 [Hibiscus syriacus]